MMSKEAMKLALKRAFQLGQDYWYQADHDSYRENKKSDETLAKFRQLVDETCEALAEQPAQQEPVGWIGKDSGVFIKNVGQKNVTGKPLYTSPPAQRTWVGLSDAQNTVIWANSQSVDEAIRATEKQLMENNI